MLSSAGATCGRRCRYVYCRLSYGAWSCAFAYSARAGAQTRGLRAAAIVRRDTGARAGCYCGRSRTYRFAVFDEFSRMARLRVGAAEMSCSICPGWRAPPIRASSSRMSIARVLAAEPDGLVLDEPTSALDLAPEAAVQASLTELQGRLTLFVVAHRVSTISACDRILVMAERRIEAFAVAAELELSSAFYQGASALARGIA